MVATTRVTTDRVNRVKIDPYDQVFALTQKLINDGLETNWLTLVQAYPTLLEPFREEQPGAGGVFKAVVQAPQVMVETGFHEDLSGLIYLMNFDKGTFVASLAQRDEDGNPVRDPDTDETVFEKKTFSLAGWSLAFNMQLGMTLVERTSDTFKKLEIKAGEYSLNELSANFDTAVFNPTMSKFGKTNWRDMEKDLQDTLKFIFDIKLKTKVLDRLKKANTVGYALKTDKPQEDAPKLTFQPNEVQYQTYPYIPPGSINFQPVSGYTGISQLNYLLYAETTDKRVLPPITQRMIPRNGNWTDGTIDKLGDNESGDYGSFYMSRENFFNRYLLKKLRKLNRVLEPWHTYVKCEIDSWTNGKQTWHSDMNIGNRKDKNEEDGFYDFTLESTNPPVWTFKSDAGVHTSEDNAGHQGWSAKVRATSRCACSNSVSFVPGTDLIEVKGTVTITNYYYWWNHHVIGSNEEKTDDVQVEINWSITLDLEAVSDGGLQIFTTFNDPEIKYLKQDVSLLNDWLGKFKDNVATAINNQKNIRQDLAKDLAGQQGLILPAGGVFYFKNPIITNNGDLTCSVSYKNNITPGSMLNSNDKTPVNKGASDRAEFSTTEIKPMPDLPTSVEISFEKK